MSEPVVGPEPVAPVAPVTAEAVGEEGYAWRRMHPVTPAVRGWRVLVGVLAVGVWQVDGVGDLVRALGGAAWLVLLGALVLVTLVGFAYAAVAWRMTRFAVTEEAVHLRTGILFRQQRQARLDRLQAVDVVQPLLARLLGLAELKLDVAGGAGSGVSLSFLREAEAERLRAELLALAGGARRPVAGGGTAVAPAGGATDGADGTFPERAGLLGAPSAVAPVPEQQVYEVPMTRLVLSLVRSPGTVVLLLVLVGLLVAVVWTREVGFLAAFLPGLVGSVGVVASRVNTGAGFRAATSADGIRLRHGLTESRAQTVPPGRVQAVRLTQGVWWRGPDWWRVEMNVAGYAGDEGDSSNVLLPVGNRDDATTAVWLVLPDLGVADPRALLDDLMGGAPGAREGAWRSPAAARWLDALGWRRRAAVLTPRALLSRSGRWTRVVEIVPLERTQSLGVAQGPVQRRLGLASVVVHSTPGPVTPAVDHLGLDEATRLLDALSGGARAARAAAGAELWRRPAEDTQDGDA